MKSRTITILAVLFLAASVVSVAHFQNLIVQKYALYQELLLTLKTGKEPHPEAVKEAVGQGTTEAYAQLGVYTLSIVIFVLCVGALAKQLRITSRSRPTR
jgi:hypothetical protein